jgi:hypothetical protein
MSYILDTLKKLEKEKSEFDNKLDIKKMILKDDSEKTTIKILRKRSHLLTFLILTIAVFFFLNFSVFKFSPPASNPPPASESLNEKKILKQTRANPVNNPVKNSVSSPEISNEINASKDLPLPSEKKDNVLIAVNIPDAQDKKTGLDSKKIEVEKEKDEKIETLIVSQEISDDELKQRLDHIEQLIQEEYIPNELDKQIASSKKNEKLVHNLSSKTVSQEITPQGIDDLKISGIVFFDDNTSLNYAIGSYKGGDQIKLKEGDRLDEIEVIEIKPEKVLLIYQNKIFENKMGR